MLLEEGLGECMVPPYSGETYAVMLTVVRSVRYSSLTPSNDASAIGYFGVGSASLASRISSCHAHCVTPLGGLRVTGWRIASLARSVRLKNPRQIVRVTDGDGCIFGMNNKLNAHLTTRTCRVQS